MGETKLVGLWVYLAASPLGGLTLTCAAYALAHQLYVLAKNRPILHPVLISVTGIIAFLFFTKIPYAKYFEGAQFVHFLLGPAVVALAVPLRDQISRLKSVWPAALAALFVGVIASAFSSTFIARALGADATTQFSLAPKSVTAPVAMGISREIGGLPSLTAALVVMTGILGAVIGPRLFDVLRIRDEAARGFALGAAAHGIGTARAFQLNKEMGAFAGLAMALSAILSAILLPWVMALFKI